MVLSKEILKPQFVVDLFQVLKNFTLSQNVDSEAMKVLYQLLMFNARILHQNKLSTNLKLKSNPQEHKFVFNVKLVLLSKNQSLLNLQFLLEVISKTFQALSSIITLMHLWSFLLNPPMVLKMEGLPFKFGEQISETLVMIQLALLVLNQSQQKSMIQDISLVRLQIQM